MKPIQTGVEIKRSLLHRYLFNLQRGMDCLYYNDSAKFLDAKKDKFRAVIRLPYTINGQPLTIYANSISARAWQGKTKHNIPILLSDRGQLLTALMHADSFRPIYLNAWQLLICDRFNAIIDMQRPEEIESKYDYSSRSKTFNITSLAYRSNFEAQLCSYIAFAITVRDIYTMYFQTERE